MGNDQSGANRRKFSDYYVNGERIGSGTFATVKRCVRKSDKKEFAVKIIDKRHLTGRELVGLKDEIRILKSMEFPHVISMIDVFDDGRRVKMVLELCEGGDLFDQILKSPKRHFDEAKSAHITCIIARSLQYLHQHFVVHRDLKPENILFTADGVLKITDFGLAHYLKLPPSLHVMHTCCGTPHYVAPEVLSSNEYSHEVDFWSLGVILYIMLSGYQPFNSHSIHAMYGMIIRGQYKFPSPHWDHISDAAKDLVRQLMCVDHKKRFTVDQVMKHAWIAKHVDLDKLARTEASLLQQQRVLKHGGGKGGGGGDDDQAAAADDDENNTNNKNTANDTHHNNNSNNNNSNDKNKNAKNSKNDANNNNNTKSSDEQKNNSKDGKQ